MPYMKVSVSKQLTDEQRAKLLEGLQNALWTIPDKKGVPVIINLDEGQAFYVKGEKMEEFVEVNVQYFSNFRHSLKKGVVDAAFAALKDALGWSTEHMFVFINERQQWGAHGEYLDEYVTEF